MFDKKHDLTGGRPAPQTMTQLELLTVCKLLKEAGMGKDALYIKFEIFAKYATERAAQGRAYIALQAD